MTLFRPNPPYLYEEDTDSFESTLEKLNNIQKYIEALEYNYSGKPFIRMRKSGGIGHIKEVSEQLIASSLPIQCVEAVFLACYLSSNMTNVIRIPLSFKSKYRNLSVHRHMVLAVCVSGKWGALGISRRRCLMDKPVISNSLYDLIIDYRQSYHSVYHKLLTIYLGMPFPHHFLAVGATNNVETAVPWRALKVRLHHTDDTTVKQMLNEYCSIVLQDKPPDINSSSDLNTNTMASVPASPKPPSEGRGVWEGAEKEKEMPTANHSLPAI
jgi:hypothetical protein